MKLDVMSELIKNLFILCDVCVWRDGLVSLYRCAPLCFCDSANDNRTEIYPQSVRNMSSAVTPAVKVTPEGGNSTGVPDTLTAYNRNMFVKNIGVSDYFFSKNG